MALENRDVFVMGLITVIICVVTESLPLYNFEFMFLLGFFGTWIGFSGGLLIPISCFQNSTKLGKVGLYIGFPGWILLFASGLVGSIVWVLDPPSIIYLIGNLIQMVIGAVSIFLGIIILEKLKEEGM